jgi:hypothetical protein
MKKSFSFPAWVSRDRLKGWAHLLYHLAIIGLSAAFALSLPSMVRFTARHFLAYWSLIGSEKIFLVSVEMALAVLLVLISSTLGRSWRDRRLSKMAKSAGLVHVAPARGFLSRWKIRRLKEKQGFGRDIMIIGSTGFRTFVDPQGELFQVVQNCREARIMLLRPGSKGAVERAVSLSVAEITPSSSFEEQIGKCIDLLRTLHRSRKNVRLKLYSDPPFLKLAVLGDYLWVQQYPAGADIQGLPKYVFKHDPNPGGLYDPFYQYFLTRWNSPDIPEVDFDTDELVYRDPMGNEMRREKMADPEAGPPFDAILGTAAAPAERVTAEGQVFPLFPSLSERAKSNHVEMPGGKQGAPGFE